MPHIHYDVPTIPHVTRVGNLGHGLLGSATHVHRRSETVGAGIAESVAGALVPMQDGTVLRVVLVRRVW